MTKLHVEPFSIEIPDATLSDLRERIGKTRWPQASLEAPWAQGTDIEYLRDLLAYWAEGLDWREQERRLTAVDHFLADVDGVRIHYAHVRRGGLALILTHGWPSTFVEHLQLVPYLDAFDLVIPSLPGYGFSHRPARNTTRDTARRWHRLMRGLGYDRYGAQGGDFGASVTTHMALEESEPWSASTCTRRRPPARRRPASDVRRAGLRRSRRGLGRRRARLQLDPVDQAADRRLRLNDSPAGLAAWIVEKWRSWSEDVGAIDREVLLTNLTLFWVTQTIGTSMRDYYDMRWHGPELPPGTRVTVPTAVALFANELVSEGTPPREWAERLYDIRRWTPMARGGHFAPAEQPAMLARDIAAFFGPLA